MIFISLMGGVLGSLPVLLFLVFQTMRETGLPFKGVIRLFFRKMPEIKNG